MHGLTVTPLCLYALRRTSAAPPPPRAVHRMSAAQPNGGFHILLLRSEKALQGSAYPAASAKRTMVRLPQQVLSFQEPRTRCSLIAAWRRRKQSASSSQ